MIDDEPYAFIIDNDSAFCKLRFSSDDASRAIIPTIVGKLKVQHDKHETTEFVRNEALKFKNSLKLTSPVVQSLITHWEEIEKIWNHALYNELRV